MHTELHTMTTIHLKYTVPFFLIVFFLCACQNVDKDIQKKSKALSSPKTAIKSAGAGTSTVVHSFEAKRVAHAGGGIEKKTYTNSYRALNENFKKGFRYFELDFSFTSDGHLVCLHDWGHSFKRSFGFETKAKVSLLEFERLVREKSDYDKCTAKGLADWMREHPEAIVITDVKQSNVKALKILLKLLPDAKHRVIPQIYRPENFKEVKQLGYEKIIWTLYRVGQMSLDEILQWISFFEPPIAVTMPKSRAHTWLPMQLQSLDIPTYVHTINNLKEAEFFHQQQKVTEIYTDFLTPDLSLVQASSSPAVLP